MSFWIELAGLLIEVYCVYDWTFHLCHSYIVPQEPGILPDIVVKISEEDLAEERRLVDKTISPDYYVHPKYMESHVVYRKIADKLPRYDTFLLHGSSIATNNQCYVFTANSGVGKTTRTKIWLDTIPNSYVVNGDKPLIHVGQNCVTVYGTPWCGKEAWNTNTGVQLRAIIVLERSNSVHDDFIKEITFSEAFKYLVKQTYWPLDIESRTKTLKLLSSMSDKIKFYMFYSSPTTDSIRLAYETIRPRQT